jgi:glycosyltransferase involved in cell wall biosynthesis
MSLTILQMLPELNVGGVEQGVVDSAIAYARLGHRSIVMSNGGRRVPELTAAGVVHITLPVHKKSLINVWRMIPKVARIIREEGVDIVHARSRLPAWIGYYAAKRAGVPFVTTVHGYNSANFYSRIMTRGARVIAVSKPIAEYAVGPLRANREHLRVIHRGIDPALYEARWDDDRRTALLNELGVPPGNRVVTIVGRITRLKGHGVFLQAMAKMCAKHPDVTPLIVGSVPPKKVAYGAELKALTEQLGLADTAIFTGSRSDVPDLLKVSDVLVSSSTKPESFGRTLVEAMATGVPVVATAHGGALDILEGETAGRLVPPGDVDALAAALDDILGRADNGREMGIEGRRRVAELFTVERMVSDTIAAYEELIDR